MDVITVMLLQEQLSTFTTAATPAQEHALAYCCSYRPANAIEPPRWAMPSRRGTSTRSPACLAAELRELQEQHAQLRRQLDAQKARADALAAALRSVLQRLGPTAGPAEVEAARALVTHT
jgi:hypothetical protein